MINIHPAPHERRTRLPLNFPDPGQTSRADRHALGDHLLTESRHVTGIHREAEKYLVLHRDRLARRRGLLSRALVLRRNKSDENIRNIHAHW